MDLTFTGELWFWRGPAPWHFVSVPEDDCRELAAASSLVSYGWGVIPVAAQVGATRWTTSLFPKDGGYLLPLKDAVRKPHGLSPGDPVTVEIMVLLTL